MPPDHRALHVGWRRAVLRAAAALRAVLGTAAVLVVAASLAGPTAGSTNWVTAAPAPALTWTTTLARHYPDCAPELPGTVPGSVLEVGPTGIPVRVGFADAWRRTHDDVRGNAGRIIASCRDRIAGVQ